MWRPHGVCSDELKATEDKDRNLQIILPFKNIIKHLPINLLLFIKDNLNLTKDNCIFIKKKRFKHSKLL